MPDDPPSVPPVDVVTPGEGGGNGERDNFEFRLLEADAQSRESQVREADQRYWLRWVAVGVVLLIIFGMGCLLNHVAHWLPTDGKAVGVVIALHLTPIASMTTLAIALLVAAFRGFKDDDVKLGSAVAAESMKVSGLTPQ